MGSNVLEQQKRPSTQPVRAPDGCVRGGKWGRGSALSESVIPSPEELLDDISLFPAEIGAIERALLTTYELRYYPSVSARLAKLEQIADAVRGIETGIDRRAKIAADWTAWFNRGGNS